MASAAAGHFASLTNAGGVFEFINNNVVTADVTVNITADLLAELGTVALNELCQSVRDHNQTEWRPAKRDRDRCWEYHDTAERGKPGDL